MALTQLALGLLQLAASSLSLDDTAIMGTPEPKRCFTCSVFTFIDNRLLCTNPGTCYSDYCYSYGTPLREGEKVAPDTERERIKSANQDKLLRKEADARILCHAHGHFGLCLCRASGTPCNKRYSNETELQWVNSDLIILNSVSHKVTGFTADYARNRVLQMRVDGYPETFPGPPLNSVRNSNLCFVYMLGLIVIVLL